MPKNADARSSMDSASNRQNADCATAWKIMNDKKNEFLQLIVREEEMPIVR